MSVHKLVLLTLLITNQFYLFSQIDHYWEQVYNPESALVGGAVVSGNGETGAAFYNPATLSFVKQSTFSLNVSLVSVQNYRLDQAISDESGLKKTQLVLQPRFIAALKQPKKNDKIVYEILILSKSNYKLDITEGISATTDVLELPEGDELYNGFFNFRTQYSEQLYGFGGAKKINDKFSFGMSAFVVNKYSSTSENISTTASPQKEDVTDKNGNPIDYYYANANVVEEVKYTNFRLLTKLGANYQVNNFGLGLNLTLPTFNLYSEGAVYRHFSQSNIELPNQSTLSRDIVIDDYQTKLTSNYKDPLSIALGAHYGDAKKFYSFSLEYFSGINEYKAIEANQNPQSTTKQVYDGLNEKDYLSAYYGANPVLNIALGHKRYLNENVLLFAGFRTDFSSKKLLTQRNDYFYRSPHTLLKNDVYHFSLGTSVVIRNTQLIYGIQYSLSRQKDMGQIANFDNPDEYNYTDQIALQGNKTETMQFKYDAVSIYIGLTYSFITRLTGID